MENSRVMTTMCSVVEKILTEANFEKKVDSNKKENKETYVTRLPFHHAPCICK